MILEHIRQTFEKILKGEALNTNRLSDQKSLTQGFLIVFQTMWMGAN